MLDALGLMDTDGNGTRNFANGGKDLEIDLTYDTSEPTDKKQVDAFTAMMADVGIRIIPRTVDEIETVADSGNFNMIERRHHWVIPTRQTCDYLPISVGCPDWHPADGDGNRELFEFEQEMVYAVNLFQETWDAAEAAEAARKIQRLWTENVYTLGLTQAPAALLINKRVKNAHPGTPVFMFEWAEDGVVRERLWVASDEQIEELLPDTIPTY